MKYRDLTFFVVGIIVTLFIFEVNIPIFQTLHLNLSVTAPWFEILTAIGTMLATIAAVFFGLGGKEYVFKPNMKLIESYDNEQSNGSVVQGQTRLMFINRGKSTARKVNVYVEEINDNGILRGNFLPVPLIWTHDGNWFRDFPPKETWFLDLCRKDDIENHQFPKLVLGPGAGVENYQNLYEGKTTLRLRVSDESGKTRRYKLKMQWQIGDPCVKVTSFSEIYKSTKI